MNFSVPGGDVIHRDQNLFVVTKEMFFTVVIYLRQLWLTQIGVELCM